MIKTVLFISLSVAYKDYNLRTSKLYVNAYSICVYDQNDASE